MAEAGDLTVRIRAIDEASPVIHNIATELAELKPYHDPWAKVAVALSAANLALLVAFVLGVVK